MEKRKEGFANQRALVIPWEIRERLRKNALTKGLYITDIGFYPNASGHYRKRDQGTPQHILIYCYEGEGWYTIGGEKRLVKANDFFILEAGTPHVYGASETFPWSIYWIHFTGEQSILFQEMYNKTIRIENSPTARYQDRISLFEEIYQNLTMGYNIENLEYVTLCLWHLLGTFRYIPQFREINKPKPQDVIQKVVSFMKENLSKHLTLEEMSRSAQYSPSYLSTVFMKRSGMSPIDYFNHLKVQKACLLLDFTDMKVKDIAYELGFSDAFYFTKVFTKYMSMSPLLYRKTQKG